VRLPTDIRYEFRAQSQWKRPPWGREEKEERHLREYSHAGTMGILATSVYGSLGEEGRTSILRGMRGIRVVHDLGL
jgi:hypothetical protein